MEAINEANQEILNSNPQDINEVAQGIIDTVSGKDNSISDISMITDMIGDVFKVIEFLFENLVDLILSSIAFIYKASKEAVELIPELMKIVDIFIDIVDYIRELTIKYNKVPILVATLIPLYSMIYMLIRILNGIFK